MPSDVCAIHPGGLATVLNEIAVQASLGIQVKEADIPVSAVVQGAAICWGWTRFIWPMR
jgi:hydrogenase maturation factor